MYRKTRVPNVIPCPETCSNGFPCALDTNKSSCCLSNQTRVIERASHPPNITTGSGTDQESCFSSPPPPPLPPLSAACISPARSNFPKNKRRAQSVLSLCPPPGEVSHMPTSAALSPPLVWPAAFIGPTSGGPNGSILIEL